METTLSFLRRKKDDGDNVRVLLLLPVLDLDAGEFAAVVVVVVVGDVFLVRKLILDLVNCLDVRVVIVVGVVTTIGAVVSGESELEVSVQFDKSGSLNGRKEDRNVCMCVVVD